MYRMYRCLLPRNIPKIRIEGLSINGYSLHSLTHKIVNSICILWNSLAGAESSTLIKQLSRLPAKFFIYLLLLILQGENK